MTSLNSIKIFVILLLFIGEALAIYAEMLAAKAYSNSGQPLLKIFLKMFLIFIVSGGFLILGYALGFKAFKNIWIVSVASITSILIIEPVLALAIFQQSPTKGAFIGLVLGAMGFMTAIFYK